LVAINEGYVPSVSTYWIEIDPRIEDVNFPVEPDHDTGGNVYGWDILLDPTEKWKIP